MGLYSFVLNSPIDSGDLGGLTPWTSQRSSKSVVEILKGLDFLSEDYQYRFETENSAKDYLSDLGDATAKYQKLLGISLDRCWGKDTERAHLKKIGEYKKSVVLTFDDGPGYATSEILAVLGKENIKGAFYVLGSLVQRYPSQAKAIVSQGHRIEVHAWDHNNKYTALRPSAINSQIFKTVQVIKKITGATPKRLRPVGGAGWVGRKDSNLIAAANKYNLMLTGWNIDTNDWRSPKGIKWDSVDKQFNNYIKKGDVTRIDVLMHVWPATARDLPSFIERLRGFGFSFTTYND